MASYNLMKSEDRARLLADRQAELDAVEAGAWPRDLNDTMRWDPSRRYIGNDAEYAATMCQNEIAYVKGLEARIAEGELKGWRDEPNVPKDAWDR